MVIAFSDECWVEVESADGVAIYGDLNRAGDVMTVKADAPMRLLFGKATAVSMNFNGRDVSLDRYTTREDTARITLQPGG